MAAVSCSWRLLSVLPTRNLVCSGVRLARCLSGAGGTGSVPWQAPAHRLTPRVHSVLESSQTMAYTTQSEVVKKVKEEIETLPASKVFAVIHISGRQFKITPNDLIVINRIPADIGEKIILEKVLLAGSENFTLIGTPLLSKETVRVHATVTEHSRTAKVIVFKKKRRKNYKRKRGHRQDTTVLRINDIKLSSDIQ